MKRIISLIMAIVFVFSLSACKNKNKVSDKDTNAVTSNDTDSNGLTDTESEYSEDFTSDDEFIDFEESDDTDNSIDFEESDDTETQIDFGSIDFDDDDSSDSDDNVASSKPSSTGTVSSKPTSSQTTSSNADHTHSWISATCEAPKTCTICNATEGEKADHKYTDGKCVYCGISNGSSNTQKPENETYSDYINYRGYNDSLKENKYLGALSNTYKKLSTKKEFNVVYFGGSVTYGYGSEDSDQKGSWRVRVGEWFKTNFPDVKINNINRAIGDTGTSLGLLRLEKDVIAKKPDLLFIEFSINDYYEGLSYMNASIQFESIIRNVKEALPECDIVTILVTDKNEVTAARTTLDSNGNPKAGELHLQAKAHDFICKKYNIPSIHVGRALADEIFNAGDGAFSQDIWSEYVKDGVHPKNKGYDIYYKVIKEFLCNALLSGDIKECEIVKQKLPEKAVNLKLIKGDVTFLDDSNKNVTFTKNNGTTHQPDANGVATGWADGNGKGTINFTSGSTDTVTVKFTGTELYLVATAGLSASGRFEYSTDGGTTWKKGSYSSKNPVAVVKGLEAKEHTVIIKPALNSAVSIDCFYSRNSK